jgi:multidrug efflux pump subunit AcrA (membrane-fusion protein)
MTNKSKRIIIICLIAAAVPVTGVIAWRIIDKIVQGAHPRRPSAVTVGLLTLKKETMEKALSFSGIVEGDPQVKVYSSVTGKFAENAVAEGDLVTAGQVLAYVGRDVVGQTFQPAPVRSPVAGMVKKLYYADRGAPVSVDKPVAEIANPDQVKIVLTVGEADLGRVKTGMEAVIRSPYNAALALRARVFSVTPFVDSDTFTGGIIVKAGNPDRAARPGMSAAVDIIIGRSPAFLVPVQAVQEDLDSAFVFVDADGRARRVTVTRGYTQGDRVEITGDLKEGDVVATDGSFKLFPGAAIEAPEKRGTGPGNDRRRAGPPAGNP